MLESLHLSGVRQALEHELNIAKQQGSSISDTLYRLLMEKSCYRSEKSMDNRLKQAKSRGTGRSNHSTSNGNRQPTNAPGTGTFLSGFDPVG